MRFLAQDTDDAVRRRAEGALRPEEAAPTETHVVYGENRFFVRAVEIHDTLTNLRWNERRIAHDAQRARQFKEAPLAQAAELDASVLGVAVRDTQRRLAGR